MFITFEGLEGAGKSVQVGLLASKLRELGYEIVATREPGGTRIGEQIRTITHDPDNVDLTAVTEAYLMAASRAQHTREIIKPALTERKIVISDRYLDSSIAYQGYGRDLGEKIINQLNLLAIESIIPDRTILLDIDPQTGFKRRNSTDKIDRLDLQQIDFYNRVRKGYLSIAKANKDRVIVIDASMSIKSVADKLWQVIKPIL